jgi:hypothetical protein
MGSSSTYLMWDIDTAGDLHFYDSDHAPSSGIVLSDDPSVIISGYPTVVQILRSDFFYEKNASQMSNQVIVRGGTYVSNLYTQNMLGDAFRTSFALDYTPQTDVNAQGMIPTVTVGGVAQTVALDTQNGFGTNQCLVSLSQDSQTAVLKFAAAPGNGVQVIANYKYNLPVLVTGKDAVAIAKFGTWVEYVVDTSLLSQSSAARRAFGELGQFARPIITVQATTAFTYVGPLTTGQTIWVHVSQINVDIQMIVAKITIKQLGGGKYQHTLECVATQL